MSTLMRPAPTYPAWDIEVIQAGVIVPEVPSLRTADHPKGVLARTDDGHPSGLPVVAWCPVYGEFAPDSKLPTHPEVLRLVEDAYAVQMQSERPEA